MTIGIAVVGGIFTLTMKLPRLLLDLQKRVERALAIGSFALSMYSMGYIHNRPDLSHDELGVALVFFTSISIGAYWILVMCAVVARYVIADREERDRARGNGAAQSRSEEEGGD